MAAVSPLGNQIIVNQNTPAVAQVQGDHQNRVAAQSMLTNQAQQEEQKNIAEVRPTEETYKIDPENEHEKQHKQEEEKEQEDQKNKKTHQEELDEHAQSKGYSRSYFLDIKI